MPQYRVEYQMRLAARAWKYVWHAEAASAKVALANATVPALLNAIAGLHANGVVLYAVAAARIAPVEASGFVQRESRRVVLDIETTPPPGRIAGGSLALPDVTQTTALIRLYGPSHSRTVAFRGIPDEWVQRTITGARNPAAGLTQQLDLVVTQLRAAGALIRFRQPPTAVGYGWKDVRSLAAEVGSNDQNTVVTTRDVHGITAVQRVVFGRHDDCTFGGLSGEHRILAIPTTSSLTLNVAYRSKLAEVFPVNLRLRRSEYAFEALEPGNLPLPYTLLALTSRDTGSARDGRGRRASRSCRHFKVA